jgi:hypothetical protein
MADDMDTVVAVLRRVSERDPTVLDDPDERWDFERAVSRRRWCMCGRPLGCKRENENFDGRIDCDHVSGLLTRLMTAGPDGVRDPVPNT